MSILFSCFIQPPECCDSMNQFVNFGYLNILSIFSGQFRLCLFLNFNFRYCGGGIPILFELEYFRSGLPIQLSTAGNLSLHFLSSSYFVEVWFGICFSRSKCWIVTGFSWYSGGGTGVRWLASVGVLLCYLPRQRISRGGFRSRRPRIRMESSSACLPYDPEASEYRYSSVTFLSTLDQINFQHYPTKRFGNLHQFLWRWHPWVWKDHRHWTFEQVGHLRLLLLQGY